MLKRLALLPVLFALVLLASSGSALADPISPDPAAPGPYGYQEVQYYGGSELMSAPASNGNATAAFQQPLDGALFYPTNAATGQIGAGPFDFILLIHGNHADCITALGTESTPSSANCASTPGNSPLLNYEGYDYLAEGLASHGFIVISVDADALTSYQQGQDEGTLLREQLISDSLDMAYDWEDGAPLYTQPFPGQVEASPPEYSDPYVLTGHIALENGVGIWGHSRGGEAVTDFVEYNRTRPSPGRKYILSGVMAWAPVDYERASVYGTADNGTTPASEPYAVVEPLCDGDVSDIHGARIYENSLYPSAEPNDPSPKIQFGIQGTDHDYTNALWASSTSEDGLGYDSTVLSGTDRADAACGEDEPNNIRLTPQDQQHLTLALTSAFMQRYVQGDTAFEPLMTGQDTLPAADTGQSRGVAPDEELKTSYFAPANQRLDVLQPAPGDLTSDLLGGSLSGTGFQNPFQAQYCAPTPAGVEDCDNGPFDVSDGNGNMVAPPATPEGYDWCDPEPVEFEASLSGTQFPTAAKSCPLPPSGTSSGPLAQVGADPAAYGGQANERESDPANRSFGPQLALAWDGDAQLNMEIPSLDENVSGYKVLAMDAAVNFFDSRNPPSGPNNPLAETDPRAAVQNFMVQLTDAEGNTAEVPANSMAYGTALEAPLGSTRRNEILNEIRIPLTDFTGIDLTQITKISLIFGTTTTSGSIELANVRFQESVNDPTTDPVIGAAPTTAPQATPVASSTQQPADLGASNTAQTPATTPATAVAVSAASAKDSPVGIDGTNLATSRTSCVDRTAPDARLVRLSYVNDKLVVTGSTTDKGCVGTDGKKSVKGTVLRVIVSLAKTKAKGLVCQYLDPAGLLKRAGACSNDYSLVADGTLNFALRMKAQLPNGTYLLRVQGLDKAGNLQKTKGVRITVKNGKLEGNR
jgi:hypothetical protein